MPEGTVVASYTGGTTSDGRALPQVRRRVYVTAEKTTRDRVVTLTPTDNTSAQYVDASKAAALSFQGVHGALAVDVPANGLVFPTGAQAGFVTATKLARYALPVPMESRAAPTMLWQVGPSGSRVMQPSTLTFPNATGLLPGRLAMLLAYDDATLMMTRVGFGKVRADGGAIESLAPMAIKSVEYLGYMALSEEQNAAVAKALSLPGSAVNPQDGGASFFEQQRERFARLMQPLWQWELLRLPFEGVAHAQGLFGFDFGFSAMDSMFAMSGPSYVGGKVRTPAERSVSIAVNQPWVTDTAPYAVSFHRGDSLAVEFSAVVDTGSGSDPTDAVVDGQLTATGPSKVAIPSESSWHASAPTRVTVWGNVPLTELGATRIELKATVGFDQRKVVLEATLASRPSVDAGTVGDGGAAPDTTLTVRKVLDTSESGGEAFQSVGLFAGIPVEVTGGDTVMTDELGRYHSEVWGDQGISCATLGGVGLRASPRVDAQGVTHFEPVMTEVPACSSSYWATSITGADILIDARFLTGKLRFVDGQGQALPPVCAGVATERDAVTGEVKRISSTDAETTEVHFFRETDLKSEFANFATSYSSEQECTGNEAQTPSHGLAPRRDYLSAGSKFTAERAIAPNDASGQGAVGRAVSNPALAEFFVQPSRFPAGILETCTRVDSSTSRCVGSSLLRQASFLLQGDGTYALTETCGQNGVSCLDTEPFQQEKISGIDGARRFKLPLPPQFVAMPGSSLESVPASVYAVVAGTGANARTAVMALGSPSGKFSGSHAAAPGQQQVGGVDLADGHLSFEHEDLAARQLNEVVRFARIYDNQNKDPSPLGIAWTHNWDGYLIEETPGRYAVVLGGQSRPFPSCTAVADSFTCQTDHGHGGTLAVANASTEQPGFVYTTESGVIHRFDRISVASEGRGRRKWMLTATNEGHARAGSDGQTNTSGWTVLGYVDGSDLLKKVQTRGSLWLDFSYVDVDKSADTAVPSRIRTLAAGKRHFKYLQGVTLNQGDPATVLHQVSYVQQRGNLVSAQRSTDLPTQKWVYTYATAAADATSVRAELLRSELTQAQLHLSDAQGVGDYVQWQASFDRTGSATSYGHVNPVSVVTSAVLPGQQGNPFTVDYQSASRVLKRPDGVQATHTLNEYGNVNAAQLPLTQTSAQWSSDGQGGGSDAQGGVARPKSQVSQSGRALASTYDAQLRLKSSTLTSAPTDEHEKQAVAGVGASTQLAGLTPDARY